MAVSIGRVFGVLPTAVLDLPLSDILLNYEAARQAVKDHG